MTDREKYLMKLIRSSKNPSVAIEKANQILSLGQPPAHEAPHPVKQEKHS